ncbi:protein LLP homolog [Anneissia japonica]|uniref:protein LLP homolog n=1 Tax=Anneissia japonica TaxID=1529436 RepID=UPI0014259DC6|nr:protein LLP homolog [Anneissia japonica]
MAKSIRSKRKRKLRNIKRTKNAPKELQRLKKCLNMQGADTEPKRYNFSDIRELIKKDEVNQATGTRYNLSKIPGYNYFGMDIQETIEGKQKSSETRSKQNPKQNMDVDNEDVDDHIMEVDSKRNLKTLKNEHGNYPNWMNHRQVKKAKARNAHSKVKKKKANKKRIAW